MNPKWVKNSEQRKRDKERDKFSVYNGHLLPPQEPHANHPDQSLGVTNVVDVILKKEGKSRSTNTRRIYQVMEEYILALTCLSGG